MAHPNRKKATVVSALILGMGVNEAARKFKVPEPTVSRWNTAIVQEGTNQNESVKQFRFENLVAEALEEQLLAMKHIAKQAQDAKYTINQGASELAVLFGVIADKSLAILGAAERAAQRPQLGPATNSSGD